MCSNRFQPSSLARKIKSNRPVGSSRRLRDAVRALLFAGWLLSSSFVDAQVNTGTPVPLSEADRSADSSPTASKPKPIRPAPEKQSGDYERLKKAKQILAHGQAFFDDENFDAALTEFKRAYDLLEGDPRQYIVLNNLAVCHERMFRYDIALIYYQRYLDEGNADAADRKEVEMTLHSLKGNLAKLRIETNVSAQVWIDDRQMGNAPGEMLIPAGRHVVQLHAELYETSQREVYVAAGETQLLKALLQKLPQYHGLSPVCFWTGVALTSSALAVGVVFGVQALSADSDGIERKRELGPHGNTPDDESKVKGLALTADILYGSAAVLAVGTTVIAFLTEWKGASDSDAHKGESKGVQLTSVLTPWSAGASLRGRF